VPAQQRPKQPGGLTNPELERSRHLQNPKIATRNVHNVHERHSIAPQPPRFPGEDFVRRCLTETTTATRAAEASQLLKRLINPRGGSVMALSAVCAPLSVGTCTGTPLLAMQSTLRD
jgi:hypothetical protein